MSSQGRRVSNRIQLSRRLTHASEATGSRCECNRPERIRLNGIDCPEKGQAYGAKAKQAASELVFGKEVTLKTHGKDKYGRTIADVLLPDGTNVNQRLVKEGWCWWYQKYAPNDLALEQSQQEAKEANRGLWSDPNPTTARFWRIPVIQPDYLLHVFPAPSFGPIDSLTRHS